MRKFTKIVTVSLAAGNASITEVLEVKFLTSTTTSKFSYICFLRVPYVLCGKLFLKTYRYPNLVNRSLIFSSSSEE